MTTHDDSNLEPLERDLLQLAKPRDTDDAFRLSLRAALAERLEPHVETPRWKRPVVRLAFAAGAAAAVVGALLLTLVGTGGSGGPAVAQAAIVRHALQAATPPTSCILHVKVTGIQNGTQVVGEWWQQTVPPYASRGMKGLAERVSRPTMARPRSVTTPRPTRSTSGPTRLRRPSPIRSR